MLELLGAEPKPHTDGRSFWPAVASDAEFRDYAVVGHGHMVSCWQDDWLYLANTRRATAALYNLAEDPFRQADVADRYPSVRDQLKARIETTADGA